MKYFVLTLSIIGFFCAQAQDTLRLYGKVITGSKPLYGVTVAKIGSSKGTVSDFEGSFQLMVNKGDAIQFSSIGYKSITYTVPDTIRSDAFRVLVSMVEDTILIAETVIRPWPVNRTMLKQAMLANKKEKETVGSYAGFRDIEGEPEPPAPTIMNPISFLSSKLGKKARQKKKMERYRKALRDKEFVEEVQF